MNASQIYSQALVRVLIKVKKHKNGQFHFSSIKIFDKKIHHKHMRKNLCIKVRIFQERHGVCATSYLHIKMQLLMSDMLILISKFILPTNTNSVEYKLRLIAD